MTKSTFIGFLIFFSCGVSAQSVSLSDLNFYPGMDSQYDDLMLGGDEFFVSPIFLDTYIDLNEFHVNIRYNHNAVEPIINNLSQINDDSYISGLLPSLPPNSTFDLSVASGGSITGVVNIINGSQSLLTLSVTGSTLTQSRYNLCNGTLLYLAFKKTNPCFKGPLYFQFWNGDDNGIFINPSQTHACEIIGATTYSTETGNLLAVNGEVLFDFPQSNILVNGNTLEASVFGGSLPLTYEWSDKLGNVLGTSVTYNPVDTGMVVLTAFDANGCLTLTSYNFYFNNTDVEPLSAQWTPYPNPTTGVLYLGKETEVSYEIIDFLGQKKLKGITKNHIDLSNLERGLYMIRIKEKYIYETHIISVKK